MCTESSFIQITILLIFEGWIPHPPKLLLVESASKCLVSSFPPKSTKSTRSTSCWRLNSCTMDHEIWWTPHFSPESMVFSLSQTAQTGARNKAPWRSPTAKERVRHLDEARGVALCADLWEMWRPRRRGWDWFCQVVGGSEHADFDMDFIIIIIIMIRNPQKMINHHYYLEMLRRMVYYDKEPIIDGIRNHQILWW